MSCKSVFFAGYLSLSVLTFLAGLSAPAFAQTFKILHTFTGINDGANPLDGVVMDSAGNLYGQTKSGGNTSRSSGCGSIGCGVVYKLSPNADGTWSETLLHQFVLSEGTNGSFAAPVLDTRGNLFGTVQNSVPGGGAVFELSPNVNGTSNFSVLHTFTPLTNGYAPYGVILHNGSLFGTTTEGGGGDNQGLVFQMSQTMPNRWNESTLHTFSVGAGDYNPDGVVFDAAGNLYGTNFEGGAHGQGSVYKMTRNPVTGQWSETDIYAFSGPDGAMPLSTLTTDAAGNLYSTTSRGGASGWGTVFELSPNSDGTWSEQVLYSFAYPEAPIAGVTFDHQGNLLGVTGGFGLVYRLTPSGSGQWTYTLLHHFNRIDGDAPYGMLLVDAAGNIFGTTNDGGSHGKGVVFEIAP